MKDIKNMKKPMSVIAVIAAVCVTGLIAASVSTFADLLADNSSKNSSGNIPEKIGTTNQYIGEDAAKAIVIAKVPGATIENITEFYLENDEGKVRYDGKLYFENVKYEFLINAIDGTILEWEQENKKTTTVGDETSTIGKDGTASVKPRDNETVATSTYIGIAKVKEILLFRVPGATIGNIDLEYDDGNVKYEGEIYSNNVKYEFEINAVSGAILAWELDSNDDSDSVDVNNDADSTETTDETNDAAEDGMDATEDVTESND